MLLSSWIKKMLFSEHSADCSSSDTAMDEMGRVIAASSKRSTEERARLQKSSEEATEKLNNVQNMLQGLMDTMNDKRIQK